LNPQQRETGVPREKPFARYFLNKRLGGDPLAFEWAHRENGCTYFEDSFRYLFDNRAQKVPS